MPTFQTIKTEYANGHQGGADYGSRVRILMRSPTHFMFVARGIRIYKRATRMSYTDHIYVSHDTRPSELPAEGRKNIDKAFGVGAADIAWTALTQKGKGTVLVDGGGVALPLPHAVQVANNEAAYDAVSPTMRISLEGIDCCKQCGTPLRPKTVIHHLGNKLKDDHPKTIEECQRLTNNRVIAITGYSRNYTEKWGYVDWFETWDGDGYVDPDFCDEKCAAHYGRRAARGLDLLPADGTVIHRDLRGHSNVNHYEPDPVRFTESGLRY